MFVPITKASDEARKAGYRFGWNRMMEAHREGKFTMIETPSGKMVHQAEFRKWTETLKRAERRPVAASATLFDSECLATLRSIEALLERSLGVRNGND